MESTAVPHSFDARELVPGDAAAAESGCGKGVDEHAALAAAAHGARGEAQARTAPGLHACAVLQVRCDSMRCKDMYPTGTPYTKKW